MTKPAVLKLLHTQYAYLATALVLTAIPLSRETLLYLIPVSLSQVSIRQHFQISESDLGRQVRRLSHLHILLCAAAIIVVGCRSHPAVALAGAVTLDIWYPLAINR